MTKEQRWNELPAVLPDVVLDELVTSARYDELPNILRTKFEGIADGVVLPPLRDEDDDQLLQTCVRRLRRLDPATAATR